MEIIQRAKQVWLFPFLPPLSTFRTKLIECGREVFLPYFVVKSKLLSEVGWRGWSTGLGDRSTYLDRKLDLVAVQLCDLKTNHSLFTQLQFYSQKTSEHFESQTAGDPCEGAPLPRRGRLAR